MIRTAAIAGILLAAAARAGDGAPASGAVYWIERDGPSAILMKDVPGEKPVWMADLKRSAWVLRRAPSGNLLGWDPEGVFETVPDGRVVWELPVVRIADGDLSLIRSVDPLPNGNLLVVGASREEGRRRTGEIEKIRTEMPRMSSEEAQAAARRMQGGLNAGLVVVEIDRGGKRLRSLAPPVPATAVRAGGADTILWVHENRVIETDWSGKEIAAISLEKGSRCQDAVRLPTGHYLVIADTVAVERAKGKMGKAGKIGVAAEVAPDGTVVWQGMHECPRSIQVLPGGNALVGAG